MTFIFRSYHSHKNTNDKHDMPLSWIGPTNNHHLDPNFFHLEHLIVIQPPPEPCVCNTLTSQPATLIHLHSLHPCNHDETSEKRTKGKIDFDELVSTEISLESSTLGSEPALV